MSVRSFVNVNIAIPAAVSRLHDWQYIKLLMKKRNSRRSQTARSHVDMVNAYDKIIKSESFQYSNSPFGNGLLRMKGSRF